MLLGMSWQEKVNPTTNYTTKTVTVGDAILPSFHDSKKKIRVTNLGVKRFRSMLRKKEIIG